MAIDPQQKRYWQVASGDVGRDFSQLFLEHDVMSIGPGRFGRYDQKTYDAVVESGEFSSAKITTVRKFHDDIQIDDIVLLRNGHEVVGLGVVASDYDHDERFDDIHGWDLQHFRRVIWQHHLADELTRIQKRDKLFGHLKQQTTFSGVTKANGRVLDRIEPLIGKTKRRPLAEMPPYPSEPLSLGELGQQLFSKGIANDAVDRVLSAIERQRRLLKWYEEQGAESKRPKEHEVVAHMVLPLLLALGWSEQLLAIEWDKIDLAAFCKTPTTAETCVLVCETKEMKHGLHGVLEQAVRYVKTLRLKRCERILLTQGARYYLYDRPAMGWSYPLQPTGYLNVEKIRTDHVYPPNSNAVDTIVALSPLGAVQSST